MTLFCASARCLTKLFTTKTLRKILSASIASPLQQQKRLLNVQEHVSYSLLNGAGIPTPKFGVAQSGQEAFKIAESLKTPNMALKAQVLAGGRGKGYFKNGLKSGVHFVYSPEEAEDIGGRMINQYLVTKQTGEAGRICKKIMVAERKFPRREFYFAIMMERAFSGPVMIASSQGGVNIEDVAAEDPDAIVYKPIDIECGLTEELAAQMVDEVGICENAEETLKMLLNLYKLFVEKDALLVEINPYAEDVCGGYFALDAKLRFDDSAEFRQKDLFALRDLSQEDAREIQASKYELNYIPLDGNIGCMVNGAGLAMATMDIIKLYGGEPANFLDVGGGATPEAVKEAFKIITSDSKVQCVLVNIFGGIMRCDIIAQGVISAFTELKLKIPIVIRLQGTNVKEARDMVAQSGLKIIPSNDLSEAANMSVHLAEIVRLAQAMELDVNFELPNEKGKSGSDGSYKSPCERVEKQ